MDTKQFRKTFLSFSLAVIALFFMITPVRSLKGAEVSGPYRSFVHGTTPEHRSYTGDKPSKGKFLVAGRGMADPRFRETVILLIKHDQDGAIGLIINRPTEVRLSTLFPEMKGLQKRNDALFIGGPVAREQVFMLIRSGGLPEESLSVVQDVYVSSSIALLKRMVDHGKAKENFRLYNGYSGWTARQLEREVSRGDWHVLQADGETIFSKDAEKIWPELILRTSAIQVRRNQDDPAPAFCSST